MIGVVLCAHGGLADSLLETTRMIVGDFPQVATVGVRRGDSMEDVLGQLRAAITEVNQGEGVLILCDMFGGTPSNLALSFLDEVEVLTGVNLPMMLKLYTARVGPLAEVAMAVRDHARDNILVAGQLLRSQVKAPGGRAT